MGPFGSLYFLLRPYNFQWVAKGPYRSFIVSMDSNGSLKVLISPYASSWILMGPYESF